MAEVGHQYSLCWFFWHTPRLSQHWGCLNTICPDCHVPSPQIHFIDFKHTLVFLTPLPLAHLFRQTIQSSWYPPHLTAASNCFLWPSGNVKPSTWLLVSHHDCTPAPSHLCPAASLHLIFPFLCLFSPHFPTLCSFKDSSHESFFYNTGYRCKRTEKRNQKVTHDKVVHASSSFGTVHV